jgi:hypothetical protein
MLSQPATETVLDEEQGVVRTRHLGLEVLTIPEGQRVMLVKGPDDTERVCAPRESDEGMGYSEGLSIALPGDERIGGDVADQPIALAHPTGIVQLAREMLFRACELSLNVNADPAETLRIYDRFLDVLQAISPALQTPPNDPDAGNASDAGSDD